jgi:L-amino acid N-acyltransferase YncA
MTWPPSVGDSYQDRGGRKWTVTAVVESGLQQGASLAPHEDEGRRTVGIEIIQEEFDQWEAAVRVLP